MTRSSLGGRVARGLFVCFVFVTTLEVSTRVEAWWRWGAPFFGPYSSEILRVTDELGTRNRPGARFEKWVINSAGFRGPEVSIEKAPGVLRVGVAGASEVFGLYESPEMDLTAQLRTLLSAEAPGRFEVVNLASAGMSPPRIRELFERWAGRFDFDVVVVYPTPAFYLDVEPPRRALDPPPPSGAGDPLAFSLRLPDKVWRALRASLPAALQAWLKRAQIASTRSAHPPDWVFRSAPADRVDLFSADVIDLVRSIGQTGARVILATHAQRFTLPLSRSDSEQMDGWIRFCPRASGESLLDMERQANLALQRIAREHGLALVDVQAAVGKDPGNYADFSHFTDRGAARAAASLATAIRAITR